MNLNYINLEIILTNDVDNYQITQNEFKEITLTEQEGSLPSIDLLLSIKSEELFQRIKDSTSMTLALGIHYDNMDIMTLEVVSFKTSELSKSRNVNIKAVFSTEEFNKVRHKRAFHMKKPSDVLKELTSVKIDTVDLPNVDTFYQLNISDWDFLSKLWSMYSLSDTGGVILSALTRASILRVRDSSKEGEVAYKLSPDGTNKSLAYVNIGNDTLFDEGQYRDSRTSSVVHSSYKSTEIVALSEENPYWDQALTIDNGNCSDTHFKAALLNKIRRSNSQVINVQMIGGNCPISLLDFVDLEAHEPVLSGKYYVTKVTTRIQVGMNVSLHLRRF